MASSPSCVLLWQSLAWSTLLWSFQLASALSGGTVCPACPNTCLLRTSCESYIPFAVSLRWLKSAQFAGFYAAKALGYWEDECLGVSLRPATFEGNPIDFEDLPADTRATIPHYMYFLNYFLDGGRDVLHVSQYMRKSGIRWWTSPVLDPERTLNITGFKDLENVVLCTVTSRTLSPEMYAAIKKHNKTACGYAEPDTGMMVECTGRESLRFSPCNFGIEEVLDVSETYPPTHVMDGMVYDQLGQMLSTVSNGRLYKEDDDFKVFSFEEDGIFPLDDGIMINSSWLLEHPKNEETLVRFLKGLHKGWIYCRENPEWCADQVAPNGEDPQLQMHQRYQMHEVNKLIWPAPGGIGMHPWRSVRSAQDTAFGYGLINRTVPLEQHTVDKYVMLANQRLLEEGFDVEGAYFTQPALQRRLEFCLDTSTKAAVFCAPIDTNVEESLNSQNLVLVLVLTFASLLAVAIVALLIMRCTRYRGSPAYRNVLMKRNPPGVLGTDTPVTIVVTDIESSTALWAAYPEEMMEAQAQHDKCLRRCLHDCFGYEVHTEGDSFTVVFHEAEDALRWCACVQVALHNLSWPAALRTGSSLPSNVEPSHLANHSGHVQPFSCGSTISGGGSLRGGMWKSLVSSPLRGLTQSGNRQSRSLSSSAVDLTAAEIFEFCEEAENTTPQRLTLVQRQSGDDVFRGLRVRMGVHTAPVRDIRRHAITNRVIYDEALLARAKLVCETGCGGQVILTSDTIANISSNDSVASYAYVLHMGCHVLSTTRVPVSLHGNDATALEVEGDGALNDDLPPGEPVDEPINRKSVNPHCFDTPSGDWAELFMLLPHSLLKRVLLFGGHLSTAGRVSQGYFQAPGKESVTICFTSVHEMANLSEDLPGEAEITLSKLCQCTRASLARHGGYECEERKGCFMVAFKSPIKAVGWATELQAEMLDVSWPEAVLDHPSCQTWQMDNEVIFNGPRLSIALSHGAVVKKVPNPSTGRADYFGPLLNHTARILSNAAPGQVLIDGATWALLQDNVEANSVPLLGVNLGEFQLKGVEQPVRLYQVSREASAVALRSFPVIRNKADERRAAGRGSTVSSIAGEIESSSFVLQNHQGGVEALAEPRGVTGGLALPFDLKRASKNEYVSSSETLRKASGGDWP